VIPVFVMLRRRRLLVRSPRAWNILTALVYPWLLVTFVLAGGALSALHTAQGQTHVWVSGTLGPLARTKLPAIRDWLTTQVDWGSARELTLDQAAQRVLARLYYQPRSGGWLEQRKARAINYLTLNFGKWVITAGLGALAAYAVGRTGESLGLDDETIRFSIATIREMDLSRVDENVFEVFERALLVQLDKLFKALYLKVGLLFIAALLPVLIEILVYFVWYQRRTRSST
jgi:hypothetical protein